jgi:anti-sigma factor ChrR (cupin superfamily)
VIRGAKPSSSWVGGLQTWKACPRWTVSTSPPPCRLSRHEAHLATLLAGAVKGLEDLLALAPLYALGALTPEQTATFETHLRQGCPDCQREFDAMAATVGVLGYAAPPAQPPAELRTRLLASLQPRDSTERAPAPSSASKAASPMLGGTIIRSTEGVWEAADLAGLQLKPLFREAAMGRVTALVRMTAGGQYPPHRHLDTEELYILVRDLTVDQQALGPGDYCAATAGTSHGWASSAEGCTFVLVTTGPEILTAMPDPAGSDAGVVFVRAAEGQWRAGPTPGTAVCPIFIDPARHTMTALVRMQAGASLPRHRHVSVEQLLMLEGDGYVPGYVLGPGDYYRMPAGSVHEVTSTENGCTFLLIASRVEILA